MHFDIESVYIQHRVKAQLHVPLASVINVQGTDTASVSGEFKHTLARTELPYPHNLQKQE